MTIQWFPGHMTRALRDMKEKLKLVDVVIEVCDARIPFASRNPEIAKLARSKPRLVVLTKADLADPLETERWLTFLRRREGAAMALDATRRAGLSQLMDEARETAAERMEREQQRGRSARPVRAMIVGIPNAGKSTLIKSLAGRKAAITADKPGVTRAPQWIRCGSMEMMDMPGVLWPKILSERDQLALAATGAIRDEVLDVEDVAYRTLGLLLQLYPEAICERLGLGNPEAELYDLYQEAARRRGCILSGGRIDTLRFAILFLNEVRGGKFGRMTLQPLPKNVEKEDTSTGGRTVD